MKTIPAILFGLSLSFSAFAQDISVTFSATGAATIIDSVTALNIRTSQSVTFPGNETLTLKLSLGIQDIAGPSDRLLLYPNPFSGDSKVVIGLARYQKASLTVYNLIGQPIARTEELFEPGEHEFALSVKENGIYTVVVETQNELLSSKAVCLASTSRETSLHYLGWKSTPLSKSGHPAVPNNPSGYDLEYITGDVIHYTCYSGVMTTIFTDKPAESANHEVAFVYCTDPDGRNYKTVIIGSQTWMAENLAYLPQVSSSNGGSDTDEFYYVYGYNGSDVVEAKQNVNYKLFGCLYNRPAALESCPKGWHLPSGNEWGILINHLLDNGFGFEGTGNDIGKALSSNSGWTYFHIPGTIGNDQKSNNSSGFNGQPGGSRSNTGYSGLGDYAVFYSASTSDFTTNLSKRYQLFYQNNYVRSMDLLHEDGLSVRCLKDHVNTPPKASFTITPLSGSTETIFSFDASATTDLETPLNHLRLWWDWEDDGTIRNIGDPNTTMLHQYSLGAIYRVRLTVIDQENEIDTISKTITVTDTISSNDGEIEYYGKNYKFKKIGNQTWMIENLAYLPEVSPPTIGSNVEKHYYVYGYDGNSVSYAKETENYNKHGVLYNWSAAQSACPPGWHLPSDGEFKILELHLGMTDSDVNRGQTRNSGNVGKKLKSKEGWELGVGDNSSRFNALPGGTRRNDGGSYFGLGLQGQFWLSSEFSIQDYYWTRILQNINGVTRIAYPNEYGFSVRCLRD